MIEVKGYELTCDYCKKVIELTYFNADGVKTPTIAADLTNVGDECYCNERCYQQAGKWASVQVECLGYRNFLNKRYKKEYEIKITYRGFKAKYFHTKDSTIDERQVVNIGKTLAIAPSELKKALVSYMSNVDENKLKKHIETKITPTWG